MAEKRMATLTEISGWLREDVKWKRKHAKDVAPWGRGALQRIADGLPSLEGSALHRDLIRVWQGTSPTRVALRLVVNGVGYAVYAGEVPMDDAADFIDAVAQVLDQGMRAWLEDAAVDWLEDATVAA